jgi:hypothetical protein
MSWDDGIRLELLRALTAIARTAPQLVAGHLPGLSRSIDETCPDQRQALLRLTAAVEGFDDDE